MIASSRSRLFAAGVPLLALIMGPSHGLYRPAASDPSSVSGTSFLVTSTDDSGRGSLRQAIVDANASPNGAIPDRIVFAIPGRGPRVIFPLSPLPSITDPVVVDGFTQSGARPNALGWVPGRRAADGAVRIVIDGSRAGDADGLILSSGDSAVRGLAIGGFSGSAIRIEGRGHNRIEGNVLGRAPAGDAEVLDDDANTLPADITGNRTCAITIEDSTGNVVGGLDAAARNVMRGNGCGVRAGGAAVGGGNAILGNSIASNAAGIVLGEEGAAGTATDWTGAAGTDPETLVDPSVPRLSAVSRSTSPDSPDDADPSSILIEGTVTAAPLTSVRIEVFATDPPTSLSDGSEATISGATARALRQGDRPVASQTIMTTDDGVAAIHAFVPFLLPGGTLLTATATDSGGNTSEFSLPLVVPGIVVSWKNAVDGNWDDTGNWNPSQVPGELDTADITIAGTYKVTVNVPATIAGFAVGGASGTQTLSDATQTLTVNGPGSVNANGVLELLGGVLEISSVVTNTGTVQIDTGGLNVSGGYIQTAGTTRLNGGSLSATANSIDIQGGTLSGSGTVSGAVNVSGTGALSPGTAGLLSFVGDYTQSGPSGAFTVEIGGRTAGTQYDRADISGAGSVATLSGALNVNLIDAFMPSSGDSFTIMTYPRHTGTLTPNLPSLPGGLVWNVAYDPTSVVLSVGGGAASADLSIVKTDAPDPVYAASNLTYTLTVSNAGPDAATSVSVTDTLPPTLSNVSGSGEGWTCDPPSSGVITCTRASVDVGSAPPVTILAVTPAEGPIANAAAVTSATPDPAPDNNSATASTNILRVADMSVQMTDSPDPVDPGGTLTYTVTVTNNGPSTSVAPTIATMHIPTTMTNVTMAGDGWNCGSNNNGVFGCGRSNFAVGTAPPLTITATVPSAGLLSATVQVTSQTKDFNLNNNNAAVTTTLATISDLQLVMTDSPDPIDAGATVTYALAVTNLGPSNAITLSVADTLPAGLTNVVGSGSGWSCPAPVSGVLTCTRTFLLPGAAPVLTITGTAPVSGPLINSATVSSSTADPSSANNSDTEATTIRGDSQEAADLSIVKADETDPVEAGQTITWRIDVTNNGPTVANRVAVTDTLPVGTFLPRASGTGWDCSKTVTAVVCRRSSLAVGSAPTIIVTASAPGTDGIVTNTADVTSDTADPVLGNNSDSETTTITPVHDIAVLKVKGPKKVKLVGAKDSSTGHIKVQIQNRSPHDETITSTAMLGNLVHLTVDSLGGCSDLPVTVLSGSPQEALPNTLHPKQKMNVWFDVTFSTQCVNDPAKTTASNPDHDDFQILVTVDHAALDGHADTHGADDVCPRSVSAPFVVDRYPDGSIKDKGCGTQKGDGTFGDPVTIDVWVRP